jgi:CRP/FNR family cyclic AMP-dependent transcriptional regulator
MALSVEDLSDITFFDNLTNDELTDLTQHMRQRDFRAGSNLAMAEQPGDVIYVVLEGTLKIFTQRLDGTEVILAILGPGDTVGEMSLVDSAGRSANVVTLEKSTLLWMDRATFADYLNATPTIAINLVNILSKRLRLANEQIQSLATLDVYGRVARQLLAFAEQYGRPAADGGTLIPIRLTQSDIADLVGASRERINQVMVNYKRNGYIAVDGRYRITVHDLKALADRCR